MQVVAGIENQNTPLVINKINAMIFDLLGAEYDEIKGILLNEQEGGGGEVGSVPGGQVNAPTQNQLGFDQSSLEQNTREVSRI